MVSRPALQKHGGQALDLLTITLKTDSNKPAVNCIFSTISKALKKKDTVTLIGFGTFKVAQRKARKGRNPQTGTEIKIKAKKIAKFGPWTALKDAVW
jgi:DNA-binding protein HU-beta